MKAAVCFISFFFFSLSVFSQWNFSDVKTDLPPADTTAPNCDIPQDVIHQELDYEDIDPTAQYSNEDYPRPGLMPFDFNQSGKAESYPFISADGLHLLFVHHQSQDWIFYCNRETASGAWSVPIPLEFEGVPGMDDYNPENGSNARLVSAAFYSNEQTLFIAGEWGGGSKMAKLSKVIGKTATYSFDRMIEFQNNMGFPLKPRWMSNISFCEKFGEMYVYFGDNTTCFTEISDGIYRHHYEIGGEYALMGKVTPDGLNFIAEKTFVRSNRNQLLVLKRSSPDQKFTMEYGVFVFYENEALGLLQPAFCEATSTIFMVENSKGGWTENNIFTVPVSLYDSLVPYFVHIELENLALKESTEFEPLEEGTNSDDLSLFTPFDASVESDISNTEPDKNEIVEAPNDPAVMEHSTVLQVSDGSEAAKIAIGRPFPNPTNGVFHIFYQSKGIGENEVPKIQVTDLSGKVVLTIDSKAGNHSATIDLSKLPAGTYSVMATIAGLQSAAEKVILVK